MNKYPLKKRILISVFLLLILGIAVIVYFWKTTPIIEMSSEKDGKSISLTWWDIEKVGIDSREQHSFSVAISLVSEKFAELEKFTRENARKKVIVKTGSDILSKSVIQEPIVGGAFNIHVDSEDKALNIIKKMGMDKPDYYLKPTAEELESARWLKKISDNPWSEKIVKAIGHEDYRNAEKYTRKAIESDPKEPTYYAQLGNIYNMQNKKNLALEQYLKAMSLIKKEDICKHPGFYSGLASLYSDCENYPKAIATYQILISSKCWRQNYYRIELAKIYDKIGNTDLALQEYTIVSKVDDKKTSEIGFSGIERLTKLKKDGEPENKKHHSQY